MTINSKKIYDTILNESFFDQDFIDLDDDIYERQRDGDYESPEECCNCGADCSKVGGQIIRGDLYCPDCARRELND